MIRRDYILQMIQEFAQALLRLRDLKEKRQWAPAGELLDEQLQRLVGCGTEDLETLSETELLAKILQDESTFAIRNKTLMVASLLKEAGDLAVNQDRPAKSRFCYVTGLHLLLQVLARGGPEEFPEFVPNVEVFVAALQDEPLLPQTYALLMQHYERTGEFGKAEDALFELLAVAASDPDVIDFAISFYERLQSQSDNQLRHGNLPRQELEAALAELRQRKTASLR